MKFVNDQKWNNIIKGALVIFIYFFIQDILSEPIIKLVYKIFSEKYIREHAVGFSIGLNTAISLIQFGLIFVVLFDDIINTIKNFKFSSTFFKTVLSGFGIYYVVNIFVNIITNAYNPDLGDTVNQMTLEIMLFSSPSSFIFTAIMVVILGPIVEELVFREGFFKLIPNKYAALLVSSLVFGIVHVLSTNTNFSDSLFLTLPYFASGAVLGYLYIKNDSNITVTIGLHMFMNLVSLILMVLLRNYSQDINHLIVLILNSII